MPTLVTTCGQVNHHLIIRTTRINSAFHLKSIKPVLAGLDLAGVKAGVLCPVAGDPISLCDPIWQLTLRSSEMGSHA